MKRTAITLIACLLALPAMLAQEVSNDEMAAIRAAYSAAKQLIEINGKAQQYNAPRNDMQVVSHYVIPGCGPTEEVVNYYFKLEEDTTLGNTFNNVIFITRSYNVAARKFYEEYLFDEREGQLLFFFQSNDALDGTKDETRYYYGSQGIHASVKGNANIDEIFAGRTAYTLKNAFDALMNREF